MNANRSRSSPARCFSCASLPAYWSAVALRLAHQVHRPARVEHEPRDEHDGDRGGRDAGTPVAPPRAQHSHAASATSAMATASSNGSGSRCTSDTAGHRIDRRAGPRLGRHPFARAIAQRFEGARGFRDHAADAQRRFDRPLHDQRQPDDAAEPVRIAVQVGRQQLPGFDVQRRACSHATARRRSARAVRRVHRREIPRRSTRRSDSRAHENRW